MKEAHHYYRSSFERMRERGWTVIPWQPGHVDQAEVLDWLRSNGEGRFYYSGDIFNRLLWAIVIERAEDATMFLLKWGRR